MARHELDVEVLGPWSLATSKSFWEGFAPAALGPSGDTQKLSSVFCVEGDWSRGALEVTRSDATARVSVAGKGNLEIAAAQACR